jgi:hypothetical protein
VSGVFKAAAVSAMPIPPTTTAHNGVLLYIKEGFEAVPFRCDGGGNVE